MSNLLRYPGNWTIDADAMEGLRLFLERVQEFEDVGLFPYPVAATIGIRDGAAFSEVALPDELRLRSSAQVARHFYMEREATHIGKVCGILHRGTLDRHFREEIARLRRQYRDLLRPPLNPGTGDPSISTQGDVLEVYFHGHYFHADAEKRAFVAKERKGWGPLHKQAFARTLLGIYHVVRDLARVVGNALGHDQLSPCATSKKVQALLAAEGLGPAPITVAESLGCATEPPTRGVRCDIDLRVPDEVVDRILSRVLSVLREDLPAYPVHSVAWLTEQGEYRFVEWPQRESAGE